MLIKEHRADPHRVALTGQSMGGAGLWRFATEHPHVFSALVPVCAAARASKTSAEATCCADGPVAGCCPPVWAFHGANDKVVAVRHSDEMVELLKARSGDRDVRYTRYDWAPAPPKPWNSFTGHASYELAYRDPALYAWLLQQRCATCHGPNHTHRQLASSHMMTSIWHIETYGSTLSLFITGDALELSGEPLPKPAAWQVKNLNGSFAPTTLAFSAQYRRDNRLVANVSTCILDVFTLAGVARFENSSAPGQPTEFEWNTVDGTNAIGYWQPGPSHSQPSPTPAAPGNHDCHEIYNAADCGRLPDCSWCTTKNDDAHALCFISDKGTTGLDMDEWACAGEALAITEARLRAATTVAARGASPNVASATSPWAVIVVGSKGYDNYRHHADACHAYSQLRSRGIPESQILLLMQVSRALAPSGARCFAR